ncbi:MAG: DUF4268 domain-containing protein [Bacteroidales bacterium]|nr:DUF4268 domain-containing protein [Bacteroidales bacterium]MBN2821297.1 DUF4268 domain-containing protein [Bacteroidales bacterium]
MFTKEEKKAIREEFWNKFKTYSNRKKLKINKPGKWIMNDTGIRQLKLKFHFDTEKAFAGFEIETRNIDKRIELFDKLEKLKSVIEKSFPFEVKWILEEPVAETKTVSRVISVMHNVSVYNRECWPEVFSFLYETMLPTEDIFLEYKDFLKYS